MRLAERSIALSELGQLRKPALERALTRALAECDEAIARSCRLSQARELVQSELPDAPSLREAAEAASLERTSFCRFFAQQVGVNHSQWLLLLRFSQAIELLRDSNWSISRVAEASGFSERSLRRHSISTFGVSPRVLRRRLRST
jgi:transcriptional regulator GlxA family with amidase domain